MCNVVYTLTSEPVGLNLMLVGKSYEIWTYDGTEPGTYKVIMGATTVGKSKDDSDRKTMKQTGLLFTIKVADADCETDEAIIEASVASTALAENELDVNLGLDAYTETYSFVTTPPKCAQWLTYEHFIDDENYSTKATANKDFSRDGLKYTWAATKDLDYLDSPP